LRGAVAVEAIFALTRFVADSMLCASLEAVDRT